MWTFRVSFTCILISSYLRAQSPSVSQSKAAQCVLPTRKQQRQYWMDFCVLRDAVEKKEVSPPFPPPPTTHSCNNHTLTRQPHTHVTTTHSHTQATTTHSRDNHTLTWPPHAHTSTTHSRHHHTLTQAHTLTWPPHTHTTITHSCTHDTSHDYTWYIV